MVMITLLLGESFSGVTRLSVDGRQRSQGNLVCVAVPEVVQSVTKYSVCPGCHLAYILPEHLSIPTKSNLLSESTFGKCSVCHQTWDLSRNFFTINSKIKLSPPSPSFLQTVKETVRGRKRTNRSPFDPRKLWKKAESELSRPKWSLYVNGLPFDYTETEFMELFAEYGIINAYLIYDRYRHSRGFGFLEVIICCCRPS